MFSSFLTKTEQSLFPEEPRLFPANQKFLNHFTTRLFFLGFSFPPKKKIKPVPRGAAAVPSEPPATSTVPAALSLAAVPADAQPHPTNPDQGAGKHPVASTSPRPAVKPTFTQMVRALQIVMAFDADVDNTYNAAQCVAAKFHKKMTPNDVNDLVIAAAERRRPSGTWPFPLRDWSTPAPAAEETDAERMKRHEARTVLMMAQRLDGGSMTLVLCFSGPRYMPHAPHFGIPGPIRVANTRGGVLPLQVRGKCAP